MSLVFLAIAFGYFAWHRILTYLHIFQQDDYDSSRFLDWVIKRRAFDRKASLCIIVLAFPALLMPNDFAPLFEMIAALAVAVIAWSEPDPRVVGKKKLAMTARASRIAWVAFGSLLALALTAAWVQAALPFWVILTQGVPLSLAFANWALDPWESDIQKKFAIEAREKIAQLKPFTIGITGSFGKTSTKHILAHILSQFAPTLATPGSINTPMGIARVVRETLAPHHKYFICEMGAYGPGSISRLCELAPPDAAVLVTVGHAHYERFKTLDTVAQTKCELAEAAAANGGWSVMGSDVEQFDHIRNFINANRPNVLLVGPRDQDDARIIDAGQNQEGIFADVKWKGQTYTLKAPLFGLQHISNMALAFITCCRMGLDPALVVEALRTTPQIRHRLEVIYQTSGAIVIDDAYNSNPAGFKAALEVLTLLGRNRRRILISPGMIEMGDAHAVEHTKIGTFAAANTDVFLPVSPRRISDMVNAFKVAAPQKLIVPCATFAEAQKWLGDNMAYNDIVLLENDLPDLYERKIVL